MQIGYDNIIISTFVTLITRLSTNSIAHVGHQDTPASSSIVRRGAQDCAEQKLTIVTVAKVNEHKECDISGGNELSLDEKHMGALEVRAYTPEQQLRLGVDGSAGNPEDKGITLTSVDSKLRVTDPTAKHASNNLLENEMKHRVENGAAVTHPAREMQLETMLSSQPKETNLQQNQNLEADE